MKNCGTTVQNSLKMTSGVDDAIVDFPNATASIWGTTSVEDLVDAVEMVGFDASLWKVNGEEVDLLSAATATVENGTGNHSIKLSVADMMCMKNCGSTVQVGFPTINEHVI